MIFMHKILSHGVEETDSHDETPTPTLHHVPRTISSPIVQCLYELNLVNNPIHIVEETFASIKTPEYLEINPMGSSPAFEDGHLRMWESGAVLAYILERYDVRHKLHPAPLTRKSSQYDIAQRFKYLQLQQYIIATVYPFVASMFLRTLKADLDEQDKEYIDNSKVKWKTALGPVLTEWLVTQNDKNGGVYKNNESQYFLGDDLTAADLLAAKPLNNLSAMNLLDDFPELLNLWNRLKERPSFEKAYTPSQAHDAQPTKTSPHDAERHVRSFLFIPNPAIFRLRAQDM